jgi:Rieske Fe-S protein
MKPISRGQFLKKAWWMLLIPYLVLAILSVKKHAEISRKRKRRITGHLTDGIHFFEDAIVVKKNSTVEVFSSYCTHLGCHLNRAEENQIKCPCHGSAFDENGYPARGPAIHPLKRLRCEQDPISGELIIYT